MDNAGLLVRAMAERCRRTILESRQPVPELPQPLRPKHLAWMCSEVIKHSEDWTAARLHRWIGFIQCALIANHMLDLSQAKAMFDAEKVKYGPSDDDLLDHLDPTSSFEFDIGGQG